MRKEAFFGVVLIVLGGLIFVAGRPDQELWSFVQKPFGRVEINEEQRIDPSKINDVKIEVSSSDIAVVPNRESTDIVVRLEGYASRKFGGEMKLKTESNGDQLKIGVERPQGGWLEFSDVDVSVAVPPHLYRSFKAVSSSGDISIEDVRAKQIVVEASSGEIILKNWQGELKAEASSGDLYLDTEEIRDDVELEASSGDIVVRTDRRPVELDIEYKGGSGTGLIEAEGFSAKTLTEDHIVGSFGSGGPHITAKTSSGDFTFSAP
ncbi:DUF4097 family beta strand repeat-containing protein [Paenibacillus turpanensis]|uniref:DUF4097 family beta strand repeat-containing protein n=1 Tax=Paenibacillus turpanensis TaxID=2689078 RepID=UPI001407303D|nr:DUF4097 family beta strand repeat-containing protein [Paenibacillus turpanensis]